MSHSTSTDVLETPVYLGAGEDLEKGRAQHIERMITPGGHPIDFSQPAIPVQHRKYGNPIPVGLISFSMGFLMVGLLTLQVRGIMLPHHCLPPLMLFLGITQTLVGWFEMFIGNTFSATIFCSYGGFCFSYVGIFLPAFGVLEAFTDKETGALMPEFNQSIGVFFIIWSGISFLFVLAALRSSLAVLSVLFWTFLAFMVLGITNFTGSDSARVAAGALCIIDAACGFWAAMSGYWTPDTTFGFIRVNPIDLSPKD